MRRTAFFALMMGLLLLGCQPAEDNGNVRQDIPFTPQGILDIMRPDSSIIVRVVIEIAEGDSARARGLMDRRSLPAKGGMLFLDEAPREQSFWMRNTLLPLDIIFIDEANQIINIAERTRPLTETTVTSAAPALLVLEMRGGFCEQYGIDSTAFIRWERRNFEDA